MQRIQGPARVIRAKLAVVATLLLCPLAFVAARPLGAPLCFQLRWHDTRMSCLGSCLVYAECPGYTHCDSGQEFRYADLVVSGTVSCREYVGGAGQCPNCFGGTLVLPAATSVTISTQRCHTGC